jgi:hypothetical protein
VLVVVDSLAEVVIALETVVDPNSAVDEVEVACTDIDVKKVSELGNTSEVAETWFKVVVVV